MDRKYVIITNVEKEKLLKEQVKEEYKNLKHSDYSLRDLKTSELSVRPIFHLNANTTKGHVLVAMLAYVLIREIEIKIFP
ncbi:MAG: hypothetical protein KA792_01550 [Bacteroidales bacterium]|nr:hypothetical protein [Bacteroidales bacterium]